MSDDSLANPTASVVTVVSRDSTVRDSGSACLVVIYGEDLGRRIPITEKTLVIGRSSDADVQVDQESVSRNHCKVTSETRGYFMHDLGSTNGTYVNDDLIDRRKLEDGDQIKVGRTIMKFIVGGNIEAQYHEEIYQLMTIDGLTQVFNKRYFDDALEREISRCSRYDRTFCVVMFDIDHFKKINDSMGHLAGDAVLRQVAALVKTRMRRDDIVARLGGEEFAVLLPEADDEIGARIAEELRNMVASTSFRFEGDVIRATISLGVASWHRGLSTGEQLMKLADGKLYQAKDQGRDRVVR